MKIRTISEVEIRPSNQNLLASILVANLDTQAKEHLVNEVFKNSNLKASVKPAKEDTKFIAVLKDGSEYCFSYFQLLTNPDRVVKYLRKKLLKL